MGREYSWRRGDDLELGLTKDEVIVTGRERKVSGDALLSSLHGTYAPGGSPR